MESRPGVRLVVFFFQAEDGIRDENEPPQNFATAWRRSTLSANVYAAGLRWAAAAVSCRVLSLFEFGADDSAAGGSYSRSLLRPVAASADGRFGRCGRAVAGARVSPQSRSRAHGALSGIRSLRPHAQPHEPHAPRACAPGCNKPARSSFRSAEAFRRAECE